jgi:hypothetical protein
MGGEHPGFFTDLVCVPGTYLPFLRPSQGLTLEFGVS